MPIFLLALSQASEINTVSSIVSFLIIHLLVYPASNGYNSYIDKDITSIGGLEKPPLATKQLFYLTLIMDLLSILLSVFLINRLFAFCILLYILASRAYSSKQIRLKKYPFIGFLIVMFFQGAFTFYMSTVGITKYGITINESMMYILIACSLQIAGAYPLTQIYQHQADLDDGVVTLSYKLGYKGTFLFTALMFALCTAFYFLYFNSINQMQSFIVLQVCFVPIVIYFAIWFLKVLKNTTEANFKNTMRMNVIASICMTVCFSILTVLKHTT